MLWTTAVAVVLLYGSLMARDTAGVAANGRPALNAGVTYSGLLAEEGSLAYVRVALPVLLALVPVLPTQPSARRVAAAVAAMVLGLYALAGLMSIGLLYVPAVVALAVVAREPVASEPVVVRPGAPPHT